MLTEPLKAGQLALVTGGGGFLGSAIIERLVARGVRVRSLARGDYPQLRKLGVETIRGDLSIAAAVADAVRGVDIVFHVAAKAGVWGPYSEYHETNVNGTRAVLLACKAHGVPRLVYTSSPSVVFDGRDQAGVNESAPYSTHFLAAYPMTKAEAEREVLIACCSSLMTVALRPHLIWGPGDNHLVPRILARGNSLRRIGRLNPLVDSVYIDNAADAHILAAERLQPGHPICGNAYFISNGEPRPVWDLINAILAAGGKPPVTKSVPRVIARTAAWWIETRHRLRKRRDEPRITRFVVSELCVAHWFDISAARRDLGYSPTISIDEGLQRLAVWLQSKGST